MLSIGAMSDVRTKCEMFAAMLYNVTDFNAGIAEIQKVGFENSASCMLTF